MASHLTWLDLFLWFSATAAEILLLVFFLKKNLYCRFPIFFGFVCFSVMRDIVFFYIAYRMSFAAYLYSYWAARILEYLLQFAVFYELMRDFLGPLEILPPHVLKLFLTACFSITALIAAMSLAFPAPHLSPVVTMIVYLEHSSEFLRAAILLLLLPFTSVLGLRWRHYTLGVVLGFGLVATVNLVCSAVGATIGMHMGATGFFLTRYIPNIAEIFSFLIWIEYFRKPEPVRSEVRPEVLTALKGVSNQLEDLYTSPVGMVRRLMWQSSLQR